MPIAFRVSELVNEADRLRESADKAGTSLDESFRSWAETAADIMRDEVPKDSMDTHDSIEVQYGDGLTATIGPTNRDEQGRPVGFFINYGTGRQPPDDFVGRTAVRSRDAAAFDVSAVL